MELEVRKWVLFALDYVAARGPLKPLGTAIRWIFVFYLELSRDLAFIRASGMAYATLVSLVPGVALVLWVLQVTGASDDPNGTVGMIFDMVFGAVPGLSNELIDRLSDVNLRAMGIVAIVTLILVASRLYLMVERAYCDVFGVPVWRRPMGLRMLSFYFTITAVPVALVFALRSSFRLASEFGVARYGSDWAGWALEYLVLVAALKLLPATAVRWRPALLGAFVSFVMIEVGRHGFGFYIAWVVEGGTISQVYGALTIFPVFLLWIYLLWVFVLLGVEVAQVSQNYTTLVEKELELTEGGQNLPSAETALRVAAWVGWSFTSGRGPVDNATLVDRTGLDARDLHRVLEVLDEAAIVVDTAEGWLLARPADKVLLNEVIAAWTERTGVGARDDLLGKEMGEALSLEGTLADGMARWLPALGPGVQTAVR